MSRKTLIDEKLSPGVLSENLVLDIEVEAVESGSVLQIGAEAQLRVMFPCEVCRKVSRIDRGLAMRLQGRRGVLARVITSGTVEVGDQVEASGKPFRAHATEPKSRFYDLLQRIPEGYVLPFNAIPRIIGVHQTYVRVFPKYLRAAPEGLPTHRMVLTGGRMQNHDPVRHRRQLEEEGVGLTKRNEVPGSFFWDPSPFFAT